MTEITETETAEGVTICEIVGDNEFAVQCQITAIMERCTDDGGMATFFNPVKQADGKWTSRGYYKINREVLTDDETAKN